MKTSGTIAVVVAVVLALWVGYYLGYHNGVEQERRAWLATEQRFTPPPPSVAAEGRIIERPRVSTATFYSNPHSGRTYIASFGPRPVNRPDLRNTPIK